MIFFKNLCKVFAVFVASRFVSVHAIKEGELDGDKHPFVGLMVALDESGAPLWRCSGALLSPTIFLTAGHCVDGAAVRATIWFDADVENEIPGNGYPFEGPVSGTTQLYPDYNSSAFFLNDLGVVVLDEPVANITEFAQLPTAGLLDELAANMPKPKIKFTAVGYGLQAINPVFVEAKRIRMYAEPKLIQINVPGFTGDFSLLLSNNHATGGTCFGDSGGPNFLNIGGYDKNIVAAVTSFGINGNCAGTGGVFRIDKEDELDWINGFLK